MELRIYTPVAGPQDIWSELDLPNEDAKLCEQVSKGFSIKLFNSLASILGMQPKAMREALKIPLTTFNRRRDKGRFTMKESDRLYSLIETRGSDGILNFFHKKYIIELINISIHTANPILNQTLKDTTSPYPKLVSKRF